MQNGTDTALRLMIVDDSVEDAEAIVSALRNAGIGSVLHSVLRGAVIT